MKILLTGATGFIGEGVLRRLLADNDYEILAVYRRGRICLDGSYTSFVIDDLVLTTDWSDALPGVNIVVHTAARVHVM